MDLRFKVCPIQGRQLLDVRKSDIFGDFRICDTYRGGGGYDKLPAITEKRGLSSVGNTAKQFVVQLYGCHLRCPYCYVTRDGILGKYIEYTTGEIIYKFMEAYELHNIGVFHLMGGAPALYIDRWYSIRQQLPSQFVFTSDLLLTEGVYNKGNITALKHLGSNNSIFAVNIKGVTSKDYEFNTGRKIDWKLFWDNFDKVVDSGINFYLTFTNPALSYLDQFKDKIIKRYSESTLDDSFVIDLKQYEAVKDGPAW
jgi:pyruvate-formate lyase-activating enzyme